MRFLSTIIVSILLTVSIFGKEVSQQFKKAENLFQTRKYKKALNAFKQVRDASEQKEVNIYIAYCLAKLKRYSEALDKFNKILLDKQLKTRRKSGIMLMVAEIQEKQGKKAEAQKTYMELLKMKGAHPKHIQKAQLNLSKLVPAKTIIKRPCPNTGFGAWKKAQLIGIYNPLTAVVFNSSTGKIYGVWGENGQPIITPEIYHISLWKLVFRDNLKKLIELDDSTIKNTKITTTRTETGTSLNIALTVKKDFCQADLELEITLGKDSQELLWKIKKINNHSNIKLWEVSFPQFSLKVDGAPAENNLVTPWRRGRLFNGLQNLSLKEQYPGSSARFQCFAFYNRKSLKGMYLATNDTTGHEKEFYQTWNNINKSLVCSFLQFPANRGLNGNNYEMTYNIITRQYHGDWYDAARIYRNWWTKQWWAEKGPLYKRSDVPEWLKKVPVFLRLQTRQHRNITVESELKLAESWEKFLNGQPTAGTWYHYAEFKEPVPNHSKYPVSAIQGYCAPPFPGLVEGLKKMNSINMRPNVYLQSEIYNQDVSAKDAEYMRPALRVDSDMKPRLHVGENWVACLYSERWQKRYLEMSKHVLDMGFWGIYLDTFGKNHINHECFNVAHGHSAGGGNIDAQAQLSLGRKVRKLIKQRNPEFYMGGESCTELFVSILDYKLNAMNTYRKQIPMERAIYGDYILSHGRVIRGNEHNYCRQLASNFIEGMIPARFPGLPPKTKQARKFLLDIVSINNHTMEYLRAGEMLRPLKITPEPKPVTVNTECDEKKRAMKLKAIQSGVYRSGRDGSVGMVFVNISDEPYNLKLEINPMEYGFSKAKLQQMLPDGTKLEAITIAGKYKLAAKLEPFNIVFYILSK